ncbi:hypothetical protein EZ449_14365 [Pedobacter frigidisoli]|uniref:Oligosaccharide repeat unit polymerase n=1 Tax=Pedobacter frigidisoli TaxID=2530455 RepID=A0A4R0P5K5_9SPHI|nr:hypothetical protein [Pedobacter frigidisoli]TCD07713.1 hypothetical protein EZ449_14365 [Pedobacter frigidisoli]
MRQANERSKTIVPLYIPVILAYLFSGLPIVSYFIAWIGSLFIFYWSWFSPSVYFKLDLPIYKQVMRPIFLTQFIFAGFMCVTSIFYFLDHLGYRYLTEVDKGLKFQGSEKTYIIAQCQRMCLLAHAAIVTGMILKIKKETIQPRNYTFYLGHNYLIGLSLISYVIGFICQYLPGLVQVALPILAVSVSCGALLFVKGVVEKNLNYLAVGSFIFIGNFLNASLSGYKEPIIINVIILACLFLPYYKKTIIWISIPIAYILLYFLPTYNSVVRESWDNNNISAAEARTEAFETLLGNGNQEEIEETNWTFLTNRLSEMEMFTTFVAYVPAHHEYYGLEIIENSIEALIPRIFWKNKPNMEEVSMERVYDAGVVSRFSSVSAKTRPVVDAYLSWGIPGVFITMLVYGLIMQSMCNLAEKLFGSYELGCVIVFNSLFQQLWRGNNFEFMINNFFYSYIIMLALCKLLVMLKILMPRFAVKTA